MSFGTASGHYIAGVELLNETLDLPGYSLQSNPNTAITIPGVRMWALMFTFEREITLIAS